MRYGLIVLCMWLGSVTSSIAQVSIGIGVGLPGVSIGINLPVYPELVRVPDYPVYYAPRLNTNYFFYDGLYWVYESDSWYASDWYNGPWGLVEREVVPFFVLRIPVRYYRAPPVYFRGWIADAPPRWGEHWGGTWQQRRSGWDRWNRSAAPAPAPLPVYQRQYSGDRYPRVEQQHTLRTQNYRYQPSDAVVRQRYQQQATQSVPESAQPAQRSTPQERGPASQDNRRANQPAPQQPGAPASQRSPPPQKGGEDAQWSTPTQAAPQRSAVQDKGQQSPQRADPREQQAPRASPEKDSAPQGKGASQEQRRGQDKDRDKGEDRGPDRNK